MNSDIERKEELRKILELLPIKFVRSLAYTKNLTIKSRKKEPIIEELLRLDWDEEEIIMLKEIYRTIQEEKQPYATYILTLSEIPDLRLVKEKIDANKVILNGDKTQVVEDGFELISYEPDKSITARYWTHKTKTQLGPLLTLRTDEWDLYTEFTIDVEKGLIFIHSDKPQNAQSTRSIIKEKLNLKMDSINLAHLTPEEAAERFQIFKNKLEEKLRGV